MDLVGEVMSLVFNMPSRFAWGGGHLEGWRAVSRGPGSGAALRLAALQAHHTPPEEQAPVGSVAQRTGPRARSQRSLEAG